MVLTLCIVEPCGVYLRTQAPRDPFFCRCAERASCTKMFCFFGDPFYLFRSVTASYCSTGVRVFIYAPPFCVFVTVDAFFFFLMP